MEIGPYYSQDSYLYRTADELVRDFREQTGFRLPVHKEVCPVCEGKGHIVNRAIDGNGLSQDMMDDSDFMEDYWSGRYDVKCDECEGNNVIDVVDEEALSDEVREAWEEFQRDYHDSLAMHLAELRFGA